MADSKLAAARHSTIARMNEAWAELKGAQRELDHAGSRAALDRYSAAQDDYMAFSVRAPETSPISSPRPTAEPVGPSEFLAALQRLRLAFVERDGRHHAPTQEERDDLALVGRYCHRRGLNLGDVLRKLLAPVGGTG